MEHLDKEEEFATEEKAKCKLCLSERSRYTCPRCNVPYCSVVCYKSEAHANCSEGFYKDCFMEGLKDMDSPGEKQKVLDMLKRVSDQQQEDLEEQSEEEDEEEDLADRLEGVDLDADTDDIWSRLTDREKAEFRGMMSDGRLSELVTAWEPWWANTDKKPSLVEELQAVTGQHGVNGVEKPMEIPETLQNIPNIDLLLKNKPPSEVIKYSVINIIYAYAYITRLYNGDYRDTTAQCAQELLQLSGSLGVQTYSSVSEAVQSCVHSLANQAKSLSVSEAYTVGILEDTHQLIQGPSCGPTPANGAPTLANSGPPSGPTPAYSAQYVAAALSDVHRMCERAVTEIKKTKKKSKKKSSNGPAASPEKKLSTNSTSPQHSNRHNAPSTPLCDTHHKAPSDPRQRLFAACKKCEFLLSWTLMYGGQLETTIPQIQLEMGEMSSRLASHKQTEEKLKRLKNHIPRKGGPRVLIEDVTATQPES